MLSSRSDKISCKSRHTITYILTGLYGIESPALISMVDYPKNLFILLRFCKILAMFLGSIVRYPTHIRIPIMHCALVQKPGSVEFYDASCTCTRTHWLHFNRQVYVCRVNIYFDELIRQYVPSLSQHKAFDFTCLLVWYFQAPKSCFVTPYLHINIY